MKYMLVSILLYKELGIIRGCGNKQGAYLQEHVLPPACGGSGTNWMQYQPQVSYR